MTAEEELEIMADPVETKEELRVKAGTIDASNSKTVNKLQRVRKDCVFCPFVRVPGESCWC